MESVTTSPIIELRKTALNAVHRRLGAKMVNFGGWDMPVEYPASGGLVAEHKAVRSSVGIFDVSHMGDIRIRSGQVSRRRARGGTTPQHERCIEARHRSGALFGDALSARDVSLMT